MRTVILIFFYLILSHASMAQNHFGDGWNVGSYGQTVHFTGNSVAPTTNNSLVGKYFTTGNSNICNVNGRIILSSDGYNIYDSLGSWIDGGDTLVSDAIYTNDDAWSAWGQSSIFLPLGNNEYYFITPNPTDAVYNTWQIPYTFAYCDELLFYRIDMKSNNGAGKVISRTNVLDTHKTFITMMNAVRHANGTDWWLVKPLYEDRGTMNGQFGESKNKIGKIRLNKDSIYPIEYQYFSEPALPFFHQNGQLMFNNTGTQYAVTARAMNKLFLADFDRCTGEVSNGKVYNVPNDSCHNPPGAPCLDTKTEGLCFSPNGRFIYVIKYYNIFQLDLQDPDSNTAWHQVAGLDTTWFQFQSYSSIYPGPDGKVYVGNWSGLSNQMSVIDNPDVKGAGCNFCPRCLRFPQGGVGTPPNMPNYELGASAPCWPVATNEVKKDFKELLIYPNPTSGILNIKYDLYSDATFEVYDMSGRVIFITKLGKGEKLVTVELPNVASGVYTYKITGSSSHYGKIILE